MVDAVAERPGAGRSTDLSLPSWRPAATRLATLVAGPLLLVAVWWLVTWLEVFPEEILVPPLQVFHTYLDLLDDGELADAVAATVTRVAEGFAIGAIAGIVVAVLMGAFRAVDEALGPLFYALAQVPPVGWAPLLIVLFGIDETFKIVVIAMTAFFPVAINLLGGIRNIPVRYVEVAMALKLPARDRLTSLIIPAALPSLVNGLRLGLAKSWMVVVFAELFAASSGLGFMMDRARLSFALDVVMVACIVTGAIGFACDQLIAMLNRRIIR